jgi:transketolase
MDLAVIYVYSVKLGEDVLTHQPIEQLMSLRMIPRLVTIRPADASEMAEAWRVAMQAKVQRVALVPTQQTVSRSDRTKYASAAGLRRGAYVLPDSPGEPQKAKRGRWLGDRLSLDSDEGVESAWT